MKLLVSVIILVRCRGYFVDFCHVMHMFYFVMFTVKSKQFNVDFYCSVVKNLVSIKILKKVNILSLEIEIHGELTVTKN